MYNAYKLLDALSTREMKVKTILRKAVSKENNDNTCWEEYGERGLTVHCCWECKLV